MTAYDIAHILIILVIWLSTGILYVFVIMLEDYEDVIQLVIEDFKGEISGWRLLVVIICLPFVLLRIIDPHVTLFLKWVLRWRLLKTINKVMSAKIFNNK